jgi:hypothetical protein
MNTMLGTASRAMQSDPDGMFRCRPKSSNRTSLPHGLPDDAGSVALRFRLGLGVSQPSATPKPGRLLGQAGLLTFRFRRASTAGPTGKSIGTAQPHWRFNGAGSGGICGETRPSPKISRATKPDRTRPPASAASSSPPISSSSNATGRTGLGIAGSRSGWN